MLQSAHEFLIHYGEAGLLVLLALGIVGVPVPDETLLMAAGFLVRTGELRPLPALVAAVVGSAGGITLSYLIDRTCGFHWLHRAGPWLHLTEARLGRFQRWYERMGRWALAFGYFVPGVRHVTALGAGAAGLPWRTFAQFAYSGAVLWVTTFLCAGYLLGREWERGGARVRMAVVALCGGVMIVATIVALVRRTRARRAPR